MQRTSRLQQCRKTLRETLWPFAWLCLLVALSHSILRADSFFIDGRQSPASEEWSYEQQNDWRHHHRTCALNAQSPIDIQHKNVISSNQLRLQFYNYQRQLKFTLQNAHHTIKINPIGFESPPASAYQNGGGGNSKLAALPEGHGDGEGHLNNNNGPDLGPADEWVEFPKEGHQFTGKLAASGASATASKTQLSVGSFFGRGGSESESNGEPLAYGGAPTIKLDWLDDGNNEYKLRDIHFHWGERRDNGSEHAIDGRRAAMEMHLVHIKHGLDKSKIGFTSDSVAVIAILIESHRKSNADFNPIVNALSRVNMSEEAQEIEYKSLYDLLPSNLHSFYTYSGSLTTPPCYQVVEWIVMTDRLNMNAKQIEMFRNLYAPPPSPMHQMGAANEAALSENNPGGEGEPSDHNGHHHQKHNRYQAAGGGQHEERGEHEDRPKLIVPNIRMLQSLNNRTILASFSRTGRLDAASGTFSGTPSSLPLLANWWLSWASFLLTITVLCSPLNQVFLSNKHIAPTD